MRGSGACYPWAGSYSANKRSSPNNAPGTKPEVATVLLSDDGTIRRWHGAFAEGGRKALMRFEAGGSAYALSEAEQEKPAPGELLITSCFAPYFALHSSSVFAKMGGAAVPNRAPDAAATRTRVNKSLPRLHRGTCPTHVPEWRPNLNANQGTQTPNSWIGASASIRDKRKRQIQ
jgi:hypothetical protein